MNVRGWTSYLATCTLLSAALIGCSERPAPLEERIAQPEAEFQATEHYRVPTPTEDLHSFANTDEVRAPHLHLNLNVDFETETLSGYAQYDLEYVKPEADMMVLDSKFITIERAEAWVDEAWVATTFVLGSSDPVLGTPVYVDLPNQTPKIRIHYTTSPEATGLDWVAPEGTAGKEHPFLYSQSQPHYARTWIPIQDTPAQRLTFTAELTTPPHLLGLMGAHNTPNPEITGHYEFESEQPIPSYLMAIAVGNLEFQALDDRMAIYAEPEVIDAAVAEFGYTTDMMVATEQMFGPFEWDRYDQIVLPPSFPMGGMENPQLAFLTPTVIAGDQSLVNLIAHELAHSWSGNLVTNATWRDLWLNEGFTSYVENRIMEAVYGEERAKMERMLDGQSLRSSLETLPEREQVLHLTLEQRDPDTVFTSIPYIKGQQFLFFLEERFGREYFDAFVRGYFEHFSFESLDTESFEVYLTENLLEKYPGVVSVEEVKTWLYEPGLPETATVPVVQAFERVNEIQTVWLAGQSIEALVDVNQWSIHERLYFLNTLPEDLSPEQMARLDREFNLTQTQNNEVLATWLPIAIHNQYEPAMPRVRQMLTSMGRMKFLRPVYQALLETEEGRARAMAIYEEAKPGYHLLTRAGVEAILEQE
ncbi:MULTISPECIES: M1 family metallopeptidase [Gammaproteobacteria]|uniref:M1 family metallopeptidase n=1 Tax=Gammaproteobacteria TaxID=1236 RepID=UPI000DCFB5BE|nr:MULTISPECIES: M1 family metallopeptidase [Gammaproteobacteria]RTE86019.1 M1 family peptidase [Aliidiomarina sp. B3213]TCZ91373.1 M1 family peptidase [Lysobacter sp. N42]